MWFENLLQKWLFKGVASTWMCPLRNWEVKIILYSILKNFNYDYEYTLNFWNRLKLWYSKKKGSQNKIHWKYLGKYYISNWKITFHRYAENVIWLLNLDDNKRTEINPYNWPWGIVDINHIYQLSSCVVQNLSLFDFSNNTKL